jgi:transcriptional regulator with XRE-family HTH domain
VLTPVQIRMARAALGWGVRDLAKKAGLAPNTVSRFENGHGARVETLALIERAFEKEGVIFLAADAQSGPGVRLARKI